MIHLSNSHSFEYMASSGALGFDGSGWWWEQPFRWLGLLDPKLFTIVTKTITRCPEKGNYQRYAPWRTVRFVKDGVVNAIGLTNPGIDEFLDAIAPTFEKNQYNLIVSIASNKVNIHENRKELCEMVKMLDPYPFKGIELNESCPNLVSFAWRCRRSNARQIIDDCRRVKDATTHPVILKLSVRQDCPWIAHFTQGVVDAISINSIPWHYLYPNPDIKSPLAWFGGGAVSGRAVQRLTWEMVKDLVAASTTPVIGPGVWEYENMNKLFGMGAKAVSFGSVFLRYPWRPSSFVRRHIKEKSLGI